jgi:hypothetical protein
MPSPAERAELAARQADLVRALSAGGPPPEGFAAERVRACAAALAVKRARAVARAWPGLAQALGPSFGEQFQEFAGRTPLPARGGPLADGLAFCRALAARRQLPEDGRREEMAVALRYRSGPDGLVPRRGPSVVCRLLSRPRRLVVGLRWAGRGECWFTVPLARGRRR